MIIAILKRFYGIQSKYNEKLCKKLFSRLDKIMNHLYSKSTVELILKILTLKSKYNDYFE